MFIMVTSNLDQFQYLDLALLEKKKIVICTLLRISTASFQPSLHLGRGMSSQHHPYNRYNGLPLWHIY